MLQSAPMMRKAVLLAGVVSLMAGCAGVNDYHGPAGWTGTYSGTWSSPATSEDGPMTITIVDDGGVTGNFTNNLLGKSGFVTGKVDKAGNFKVNFTYADVGPTNLQVTAKITRINEDLPNPGIGGNGTSTSTAGSFPISFTLDKE